MIYIFNCRSQAAPPVLQVNPIIRKPLRSLKITHECIILFMDIQRELLAFLRARAEKILLRSEAQVLGNPADLSRALAALLNKGYLEQINDNVYAFIDKSTSDAEAKATNRPDQLASHSLPGASDQGTSVSRYVRALAKRHKVFFEPTFADRWANSVTQLADDDVKSDATDDLLVALRRAGKLSPKDMTKLVISHHREARRV